MSEQKCPYCGASPDQVLPWRHQWECGTRMDATDDDYRGGCCYESEIERLKAEQEARDEELALLQVELAELRSRPLPTI